VPRRKIDALKELDGGGADKAASLLPLKASAVRIVANPMTVSLLTRLESTELSQNSSMESLLHWKENEKRLKEVLNMFLYVEQGEITRFLPETCGALFDIISLDLDDGLLDAAFYALMHVLSVLVDERVTHALEQHRALLERYIQHQFVSTTADTKLTQCLLKAFEDPAANKKRLVSVFKGMGYLLRFIYRSVELRLRKVREEPIRLSDCKSKKNNSKQSKGNND
jgi:hypothetical protein